MRTSAARSLRFLYQTIHQEFHSSLSKLSNLLYLPAVNQSGPVIEMPREELADFPGMSRVQVSRELSSLRKKRESDIDTASESCYHSIADVVSESFPDDGRPCQKEESR